MQSGKPFLQPLYLSLSKDTNIASTQISVEREEYNCQILN